MVDVVSVFAHTPTRPRNLWSKLLVGHFLNISFGNSVGRVSTGLFS